VEANRDILPDARSSVRARITKLVDDDRLIDALAMIMEFECDDERLKALWQIHLAN